MKQLRGLYAQTFFTFQTGLVRGYFNTLYGESFIILYSDQQTIVSSSDSLQSIPCQATHVLQMQLLHILLNQMAAFAFSNFSLEFL